MGANILSNPSKPARIILVDDDKDTSFILSEFLRLSGMTFIQPGTVPRDCDWLMSIKPK